MSDPATTPTDEGKGETVSEFDKFNELARRLVSVPKDELDEQRAKRPA